MKNKILLSIGLLMSVNNIQSSEVVAQGASSINAEKTSPAKVESFTAREVITLEKTNSLSKQLAELKKKAEPTNLEKELIKNIENNLKNHDDAINAKIKSLQEDSTKNSMNASANENNIKLLEKKLSNNINDDYLKKALEGLSNGSKACYYTWYKNRTKTLIALALFAGASVYGIYSYFFDSCSNDEELEESDDIE